VEDLAFTYELFLSYASADRAWAERLYNDLISRDPRLKDKIFWDRESLQVGDNWQPQLNAALDSSRHFVSLWSDAAAASTWAGPEIDHFEQRKLLNPQGPQLLFYIPLQGSRGPQEELQGFPDIRTMGLYQKGVSSEALNTILNPRNAELAWNRIVTRILKRADEVEPGDEFWVIVLSMTKPQADKLTPASITRKLPQLDTVLKHFHLTVEQLQSRYGESVWDWKPYGEASVEHLLDELQVAINGKLAHPIRWKKDTVLFDQRQPEDKIKDLHAIYTQKPSLLIVDPFALYERDVSDLYAYLDEAFENSRLVVVSLSPDGGTNHPLWKYLRVGGYPYLKAFFDPPLDEGKVPLFGLNLRQVEEIERLVRLSVNKRVAAETKLITNLAARDR
jgi:hypothetical protein